MVSYGNLIEFQVMIFLLMLAGYILRKLNIISTEARKGLTDLLICAILPCSIISAFLMEMTPEILKSCTVILLVSIGIQVLCGLLGRFVYRKAPHDKQMVLKYGTLCPNASFLGYPLAEGLYGPLGLLYASIYLIPQRVVMWSWGVACFTSVNSGRDVVKKVLTHPCIIAVAAGTLLMVTQLKLPDALIRTIQTGSDATTALTMIVIGGILAEIDFRTVMDRFAVLFSAFRLLIIPAIVLLACRFLGLDPLVSAVSVVLTGMPAGATTAILAEKYDCDPGFAVKCVFLSTVFSLVSIPLLCVVAEQVF